MYARQITSEDTYTLAEARQIIKEEKKAKGEKVLSRLDNILVGIICLILSALIPIVCNGDIGAWIFSIPCALYFLTRR